MVVRAGRGHCQFWPRVTQHLHHNWARVLKCLTPSLSTTRGLCVQTENVLALGAAADEKEQAKGNGGVELPRRGSMS